MWLLFPFHLPFGDCSRAKKKRRERSQREDALDDRGKGGEGCQSENNRTLRTIKAENPTWETKGICMEQSSKSADLIDISS